MAETAVRPRPGFSTFMRSDANYGGDGLAFHEHKRVLRAQKVARLQQKQASTRVPGYKPATARAHPAAAGDCDESKNKQRKDSQIQTDNGQTKTESKIYKTVIV